MFHVVSFFLSLSLCRFGYLDTCIFSCKRCNCTVDVICKTVSFRSPDVNDSQQTSHKRKFSNDSQTSEMAQYPPPFQAFVRKDLYPISFCSWGTQGKPFVIHFSYQLCKHEPGCKALQVQFLSCLGFLQCYSLLSRSLKLLHRSMGQIYFLKNSSNNIFCTIKAQSTFAEVIGHHYPSLRKLQSRY